MKGLNGVKKIVFGLAVLAFVVAVPVSVKASDDGPSYTSAPVDVDLNNNGSGRIGVDRSLSKGGKVVEFTFPETGGNYRILNGKEETIKTGDTGSSKKLLLTYGTNYKPGDSLSSICQGTLLDWSYTSDGGLEIMIDRGELNCFRVSGISINTNSLSLKAGSTSQIRATVSTAKPKEDAAISGLGGADLTVLWSSTNSSVAEVDDDGNVKAKKGGRATITATTLDGAYSKTCNVSVEVEPGIGSIDSVLPINSVISTTPSGAIVPMVGENLSKKDDVNQELLAKAFAASMGKTATIVTGVTVYPTRLLSKDEDGSIQTLTFKNVPGNTGDDVYGLGYNQTDGAYVMKTELDEEQTATFEDFKLRSATNLSIFLCK